MQKPQIRFNSILAALLALLTLSVGVAAQNPSGFPASVPADDEAALRKEIGKLETDLNEGFLVSAAGKNIADASLFLKAVQWAVRYQPTLNAADLALVRKALLRGRERAAVVGPSPLPWAKKRGRLVRAYISDVDGSVQPYGLVIPARYNSARPIRLDVVLHGSTRPDGMAMLHFINSFDEGDTGGTGPVVDYIELHPMGRVENCYRWAGETDIFEAIADVCRRYNIDRSRIVLRGMSMGASGTWHLGLKHPDVFVALGPYCGYVDTHRFSETPGMNFVKVGPLPDYQEKMLHMLDSVDYAANAGVTPVIAAIGDKDPFFQAHVIMGEAFHREGLEMVNLISPGTGHVQDPVNFAEQMRRIGIYADKGLDRAPRHIRFVTWTLKYSRCHWIELLALGEHYKRAEIDASISPAGDITIKEPLNIERFAIDPPVIINARTRLAVGSQPIALPEHLITSLHPHLIIERSGRRWRLAVEHESTGPTTKRPGLQGPIDDAFTKPFLCVRGTGTPWNREVQNWADANLRRFQYEWNRYFLGDVRVKDDSAVTEYDCRHYNLILFGDPGSNSWIRKALPALPFRWTRNTLNVGGIRYPSDESAPTCICPSPFADAAESHYVVVNSGHTFHEAELNRLNYLLYPHLPDWAVFRVKGNQPSQPGEPLAETLLDAGFWNEQWKYDGRPRKASTVSATLKE